MFKKVLIANRGEIAVRVIRACKELGISTVAVYSDVDKEAVHVKMADEAVCIGPADPAQSYLNIPVILSAAEITDSEAIHPGYGFLSEDIQFAETCQNSGITFIGPKPENIRTGGDKAKARQLLKKHSIPVIPGSDGIVKNEREAVKIAKKVGYPVILKASSGGGGRGMRIVESQDEMQRSFSTAQRESLTAFGSSDLYIEKYLPSIRHIEVQIMADNKGNILHLGERDCSIQRRHQKLIEESPSPFLDDKMRRKIGEYAVKVAEAMDYENIGTVEFVVDQEDNMYFIEINTRVQVEHPVTEMVTGIDIIKEQIKLAAGNPLELKQSDVVLEGHSIECRINAEDPKSFIPSPGKISFFFQPGGAGIRVDTAAYSGWEVSPQYDSLIAKVIVHAPTRREAIDNMILALNEFMIEGIRTTIPFHKKVLRNGKFLEGEFDTHFCETINGHA
ncbi:MAG: acetyl-CoA carboxylase biotin carboxylase subunit [Nitrospirota bacterium]|nr:MAG: acetyl-CoA carboxylase biotin carboxylase subunit [Nitrospirota bacterium]